jgi:signal transduction histidine kinase
MDRGPIDRALGTLLAALLAAGTAVALAAGALVVIGVRWGLAPLNRLSQQLASVSGGTISRRLHDGGVPRELVPVYRELNAMLDRVEQTLERERSFANAAAHELRTPLAELRTTAEVALRWPEPDRAIAALREALAIGSEMERLVESLLLISRGDAGAPAAGGSSSSGQVEVTLGPIVRGCLDRAAASIRDKQLNVTVALNGSSAINGHRASREGIEIIVRNLIDNAVHYTPPRGVIAIGDGHAPKITDEDSEILRAAAFVIENGPVQLGESDLPRLFEPFWQRNQSRSDRQHVGLGLTVVHRMAVALGLHVHATLAGDRLRIRISAGQ